jgi:phosphate transport system permease protein
VMGPFTALPVQIYNWTKLPDEKFKALAAAAIIVLLIMVLLLNSAAIWLRNRYQKRW